MNKQNFINVSFFLLRVVAGLMLVQAGGMKILGWFGGVPMHPLPLLLTVGGLIELVGGAAIMLGLFTNIVAFILSGEMAVAYFMGHVATSGHMLVPSLNQGIPAVLLCFIFLFLSAYGSGEWGLDSWLKKRKTLV